MRIKLPSVELGCDRKGVSDRSVAIIIFAVLQDLGIIKLEDKRSFVVDRSKIRREHSKMLYHLQDTKYSEEFISLYFDGKNDKTLSQEKKGFKYYKNCFRRTLYSYI